MLDNSLNKILIFIFTPVVTFLDIEVFEVEGAIFETNVVFAESFPHLNDITDLFLVQFIVD